MTQAERGIATPSTMIPNGANADKQGILLVKMINGRLTQEDVLPIFNAFGEVRKIDLSPGETKGTKQALVEFRRNGEAATAMTQLNGLEVVGHKLEITFASESQLKGRVASNEAETRTARFEDESGNGGVVMSVQDKQSLMSALAKRAGLAVPQQNQFQAFPGGNNAPAAAPTSATQCLLLTNMFDPATETDPDFDLEIREDVR